MLIFNVCKVAIKVSFSVLTVASSTQTAHVGQNLVII